MSLTNRCRNALVAANSLGVKGFTRYTTQRIRQRIGRSTNDIVLSSRLAKFPMRCRPGTSDLDVFHQIFIEREYACLDRTPHVELVIDCGANVGYSAVYFLNRFPDCQVIAVEPDPGNFSALERNLAPYKDRVRLVCAAIWSHPAGLAFSDQIYRDGREWTRQVRECRPHESPAMTAVDVGTLLEESGCHQISLLKIDIEGAEAVVFSRNYEGWLSRVETMAIELHDDSCFGNSSQVVMSAVAGEGFDIRRAGELTICRRH